MRLAAAAVGAAARTRRCSGLLHLEQRMKFASRRELLRVHSQHRASYFTFPNQLRAAALVVPGRRRRMRGETISTHSFILAGQPWRGRGAK